MVKGRAKSSYRDKLLGLAVHLKVFVADASFHLAISNEIGILPLRKLLW